MLKKYICYLRISFMNMFDFKIDFIFLNIGPIANMFIFYFIFKYVYYNANIINMPYNFDDMKIYIILSSSVRTIYDYGVSRLFINKVKSQSMIFDFITPGGVIEKYIAYFIGNLLAVFIFSFVFVFFVATLLLGFKLKVNIYLLFFLIHILLGGFIFNLIELFISIFSLFKIDISGYLFFHKLLFMLFSGIRLPLFLFPAIFFKIAKYMPYRFILYEPVRAYIDQKNSFYVIFVQFIIILSLYCIIKIVYNINKKKFIF